MNKKIMSWIIILVISCGIVFASSFWLGPTFFSNEKISRKIAIAVYCPGADYVSKERGTFKKVLNNPWKIYAMCKFWDGKEKPIRNKEYLLVYNDWTFVGGALCGVGIAIPIILVPFFLFRKKKQAN